MRAAPPVGVQCTGGLAWPVLQAALAALAAGVVVWWALTRLESLHVPVTVAAAAAVCAAALAWSAGWSVARQQPVQLGWDGQRWAADGTPGTLDLMIDLGNWLLLRLQPAPPSRRRWIAVSAGDAGPARHALRTAVHAPPPRSAAGGAAAERAID